MEEITFKKVDFADKTYEKDFIDMLSHYACGKSGGGKDLGGKVKESLFESLKNFGNNFSILAYSGETAIGLVNCFFGFSTFKGKPLVNIHDIVVKDSFRSQGVGKALLGEVEQEAKKHNACKITLEVLENNTPAIKSYKSFGFESYELDPKMGRAMFMEKEL